ncbi:phosphotransferase [Leucobacter sp. W1478]|uniref:phosphotransferase n=1 Tax=Leucobacter sp. W1478 TaxID=3439065 RepID=UPI003F2EFBE5
MASTPLTLAALATSAVPGLNVHGTRPHTGDGDGAYSSAVLVTDDEDLIIRVPRTPSAEVRQSAELLGLAALAEGAREALPFAVPETRGITRAGDTKAVVTTFLEGGRVDAQSVEADALLLQPVAEALAAIHNLPTSLIQQGGLPMRSAEEARTQAVRLVERAAHTHLLPQTVHQRWLDTLRSPSLWDFAPTVVHGSLTADQLIVRDDLIVGILGWDALAAGDPATDLAWLLASGGETLDSVLARYSAIRGVTGMRELRARAHFYHQLEVARWLLHGVDTHDSTIVDDAVAMFDRLVDRLERLGTPIPARTTLSGSEVEELLDEIPEVPFDPRSETAEYEALDEDRMFHTDTDFVEPVTTSATDAAPSEIDDQATQPIDPLEK